MEITNDDIRAYDSLSLEELIDERTRLAIELNDKSLDHDFRFYLFDCMEVVCDLIEIRMNVYA